MEFIQIEFLTAHTTLKYVISLSNKEYTSSSSGRTRSGHIVLNMEKGKQVIMEIQHESHQTF